jgi:hypothetical protein
VRGLKTGTAAAVAAAAIATTLAGLVGAAQEKVKGAQCDRLDCRVRGTHMPPEKPPLIRG